MQVFEEHTMVRDLPHTPANDDACPNAASDALPLPADTAASPLPNTRSRQKRLSQHQTEAQPVKKLSLAMPAPVPSAAVVSCVQPAVTTAGGAPPCSIQAHSSTPQPPPLGTVPVGGANPKAASVLAQMISQLASSMDEHPKLHMHAGISRVPSTTGLPGTRQQVRFLLPNLCVCDWH